ncbi:diguanylate cyclase domain-containing protein [Chitinimonas sp.]|uniref:diguanylate cyclase domain-containing protein n=1 Tax=Chitinimonas sp. TaxID=1934313 RepID=UPI002F92AAEB
MAYPEQKSQPHGEVPTSAAASHGPADSELLRERVELVDKVNEHLLREIGQRHETNTRLARATERLNQIIEIQRQLTEAELDLPRFMYLVVERMQDLTPAIGAVIELAEGDEMVYRAASGSVAQYLGLRLKRAGSLSGLCVAQREVLLCRDTRTDPRVDRAACQKVGAGSMVVAPLQLQGRTVGVLKIMAPEPDAFSEADVQTLQLMAGVLGSALAHRVDFEEKERLLHEAEVAAANFRSAAEANMDAFYILTCDRDAEGRISDFRFVYINAQAEAMIKRPRDQVIGQPLSKVMPYHHNQGFFAKYVQVVESGRPLEEEYAVQGQDMAAEWIHHEVVKTGDGISISARDVTQQKRAEQDLVLRESLLRTLADSIPAQISFVGRDERYRYCNRTYTEFFGVPTEQIVGMHVRDFLGKEAYEVIKPFIDQALAGQRVTFERSITLRGETRRVEIHYIPQQNSDGTVSGFYVMVWDITQAHQREQVLRSRATTDPLTGLLNRAAFMETLEQEIHHHYLRQQGMALLFLDLDHFKAVNDTLGHAAGDELLRVFAERLRDAVRMSDHVGRLGGDEFVILLTGIDSVQTPSQVAGKILLAIQEPVMLGETPHPVGTSIGIAYAMNTTMTAEQLLAVADGALYEAKAAGRNTFRLTALQ